MKCDFCGNKAKVFLTQLVEGQMKKVCLCDDCAQERGVTDPTGFSLADLLHGGLPDPAGAQGQVEKYAAHGAVKRCPNCGFTIEELHKVRRFGCSECYRTFGEEVLQLIRGMHKGMSHVGKIPGGLVAVEVRNQRLEDLRSRLEHAIATESYEEAAGLRDEIRRMSEAAADPGQSEEVAS
ncbi:MAG: UvrB/UvrC motif-containing protein [Verrucomicrobiota bacterium]